jgi:hypothetical protein
LYLIIPEVHRNNGACQTVYRSEEAAGQREQQNRRNLTARHKT